MGKPNQKRHQKPKAELLTPEQQAELAVLVKKAEEEKKAEAERVRLFNDTVPKMSHRQLRGTLRGLIKREHIGKPPQPVAGLTIALSTVLLTVLENTKTKENPFAKMSAYPR